MEIGNIPIQFTDKYLDMLRMALQKLKSVLEIEPHTESTGAPARSETIESSSYLHHKLTSSTHNSALRKMLPVPLVVAHWRRGDQVFTLTLTQV